MDFITLTCPSCGGKLNINPKSERFFCNHCGNEHILKQQDNVLIVSPIVKGLEKVQTGVDKTASELALTRISKDITDLLEEKKSLDNKINGPFGKSYQQMVSLVIIIISISLFIFSVVSKEARICAFPPILFIPLSVIWFRNINKTSDETENRISTIDDKIVKLKGEYQSHKELIAS